MPTSVGVPGTYAHSGHAPGHAPQPVHAIATAPDMITEGRVRLLRLRPPVCSAIRCVDGLAMAKAVLRAFAECTTS